MKNILLILVGGTICSALDENKAFSVNENAGVWLKENYINSSSPYAKDVEIDLTENLFILSENMTVEKWNLIIETYRKYAKRKAYDGIVIAHGTDTLAYSSALFSMLFSGVNIPIFLVSANRSLKSEKSNGNDNFACAVECILRKIPPNVYVPYKNISDNQMYLHLASRLRQCENYSDDFHSEGMLNISGMTEENYQEYFEKIKSAYPKEKKKSVIDIYENFTLKPCVLMITPYVGINYDAYNYDKFSCVLHGTFHSGTACSEGESSVLNMLDYCFKQSIDVYLSPSRTNKRTYESVYDIANHKADGKKINLLYGYTNEMAYAKLIIAYSLFENEDERKEFINNEFNFEITHLYSEE